MSIADRRLVTGAPGTGKTAVPARLAASSTIVPEPARRVLADVRARGEEPRDLLWSAFLDLLLRRSIAQCESVPAVGPILFDRGVLDRAAYAVYFAIDPSAYSGLPIAIATSPQRSCSNRGRTTTPPTTTGR